MPRIAKLLTELVGTFLFLSIIALLGPIGSLAPVAIGSVLMVMVYMGGHILEPHYNPAVSFGFRRGTPAWRAHRLGHPLRLLLNEASIALAVALSALAFLFPPRQTAPLANSQRKRPGA